MEVKPFIHLFNTFKNYYFYDAVINQITKVSKESYEYLKQNQLIDVEHNEELYSLYLEGYLHNNPIKSLKHPMTDYVEDIISRKCNMLVLQVTQNCNLRCSYCPFSQTGEVQRVHNNKNMTWEVAKMSLDFYHKRTIDLCSVVVSFYGGEPLINYDLIKKSVEYSKKIFQGKDLMFSITTNATLLTEEIIDYFAKNQFGLTISLDGDKESNDTNRKFCSSIKSVFDAVIEKLNYINDNYPSYMNKVDINMVIDQRKDMQGFFNLFKKYDYLKQVNISINTIEDDFLSEPILPSKKFYEEFSYQKFLSLMNVLGKYDFSNDLNYFRKIMDTDNKLKMDLSPSIVTEMIAPSGPCIPGNSKLMVDIYGNLYPCEKLSEINDDYKIGTIYSGYDIEKIKKILNFAQKTEGDCINCIAFRECKLCVKTHCPFGIDCVKTKKKYCYNCKLGFYDDLVTRAYLKELQDWEGSVYE